MMQVELLVLKNRTILLVDIFSTFMMSEKEGHFRRTETD